MSSGEKQKTCISAVPESNGPAESGGVAVIVLGKVMSMATAGDMGRAVNGVSGN